LVNVNLLGAVWVTRAFLPEMLAQRSGVIVHLGGFADGRLAFPYYTVDSATRAGVRGFVDAVNREYSGRGITLTYFCPAPADTDAERPYHALWRSMGTPIVSTEQVALAVIKAVAARKRVYVMGRATRVFGWINSLSSGLADFLLMRRYRDLIRDFLSGV
jgi:short-subunit dehydrogenase